jgi:hypothetical protein
MIKRAIEKKLKGFAKQYPVILLTGPRQSGKTTLCRSVFPAKPYLNFESLENQEFAEKDPKGLLEKYPDGAVFDEIQRCPQLLSYIQVRLEEHKKKGMYILTGSQNLLLLRSVQQSLAGRVAILELLPFSLDEIRGKISGHSIEQVIYTGCFPGVWNEKLNPTEAMRGYVRTYVERDLRQIINVKNLSTFQKFLKLCAGRIGQILNLSSIGNDLGISHTTIREWLSVLEASYIIYLLPAYYKNLNKRLVKSPKLYFMDTGLACYLLGIESHKHVSQYPLYGSLFENLIVTEMLKYFYDDARNAPLYFFRDKIGNEVDLVIERSQDIVGVEVKAGRTINSEWFKGLNYLSKIAKINVLSGHLVYGGVDTFKREGIHIWPYSQVKKLYLSIEGH